MKVSDLFVQSLKEEGVEYIFGIPGEENLDLLNSLKDSGIRIILTRNEQSAVFMAATYGRYTGKPGVALATLGPGATNMVTGVGYAQLNGLPVVLITGQKPIKKSKQGAFQVIDVVSLMKPITKWAVQIQNGSRVTSTVREAFKLAASERPGAVHIELPEDIAEEEIEGYCPLKAVNARRPHPDEKAIRCLVAELENAQCPIILIGAGANRKQVTKYLSKFIEMYNIPFFESQMGKGVVDERYSQYVGTAALSEGDGVHKVVKQADLIIAVGHDVIEKPTNFVTEGKTRTVHINFYEAKVDDVYTPQLEVVGDIGYTFWRLTEETINHSWNFEEMYKTASEEKKKSAKNEETEEGLYQPRRFVRELREALGEQDVLALDNGWYKIWIARNYLTYHPNTLLLDNTFATMGGGLATGTCAKFLNPEKNVVVITGDGGLLMNLGDLETTVRLGGDITVVVINNNSYGMIKVKQQHAGFADFGLDLPNPDFMKLAESFGAKGYTANPDTFQTTLEKAMQEKGVKIIELALQYPNEVN